MVSTIVRSSEKSLKCYSLGNEAHLLAKQMAEESSLSVSAYLRGLIKKTYTKWAKNKRSEERSLEN